MAKMTEETRENVICWSIVLFVISCLLSFVEFLNKVR